MFLSPLSDDFNTIIVYTKFSHRLFLSKIWKKNKNPALDFIWLLGAGSEHDAHGTMFVKTFPVTPNFSGLHTPEKIFIVQKMKGEKEKKPSSAVFLDPPSAGKMSLSCSVFHTGVLLHKVGSTAHTHLLCTTVINVCLQEKKKEGGDQRKKLPSMIVQETLLVSNRVQFTRWSIDAVWDTRDTNESEGKKEKRDFIPIHTEREPLSRSNYCFLLALACWIFIARNKNTKSSPPKEFHGFSSFFSYMSFNNKYL